MLLSLILDSYFKLKKIELQLKLYVYAVTWYSDTHTSYGMAASSVNINHLEYLSFIVTTLKIYSFKYF